MADETTIEPQGGQTVVKPGAGKPKPGRKRGKRPARKSGAATGRTVRSFPASTFEEALTLAQAIQTYAAGQRIRRITLFDHLGKSPESGPSRQLVTNSSKYGLTVGGYQAEHIELTEDGRVSTSAEASVVEQLRARFKLALASIPPFNDLYERFKGSKLPSAAVMRDFLQEKGYKDQEISECIDTFIVNAKFLGLLRPVAGAERLLTIEHALEDAARSTPARPRADVPATPAQAPKGIPASADTSDWSKICFYVTPIGDPDTEERQHADLFLSTIVEPAVEEFDLRVVRADHIGKAGMITGQIIEHVVKARLVIADLSFHNPNVFYELSLRHACRLPTVQLIRKCDRIQFDLDQVRTVQIDTTSIYTLVPQLQTYRSEIANQVRRALETPDAVENPLTVFYPGLQVTFPPNGKKQ